MIKAMQCHFCRIDLLIDSTTMTSGWLAENHLAFSRICVYLLSYIREHIVEAEDYNTKILEFMVQAWSCLISRLMTKSDVSTDDVKVYIKIFLHLIGKFENNADLKKLPDFMWYRRGNFLSLLNLPDQIEKFGNVRHYLEGSHERFIQSVKPFLKRMRQTDSYLEIQMSNIYAELLMNAGFTSLNDKRDHATERYRNLKIYTSLEEIKRIVKENKPIFSVRLKMRSDISHVMAVVISDDGTKRVSLHKIVCDDGVGWHLCRQWYVPIRIKSDDYIEFTDDIDQLIDDHVIGLARQKSITCNEFGYTFLDKNWHYRQENGFFELPELSKSIYSSNIQKYVCLY